MPSQEVITVTGLSKKYTIGENELIYKTLRDSLVDSLKGLLSPEKRRRRENREYVWALRDVSFQVNKGEIVGIIGKNGAGKSTLLKILSRITRPTSGHIRLSGRVGSLLEVGTGFHPELTGRENIFLNGSIIGMSRREIESRFEDIVSFAEIQRFLDTPVKHYSSGMYMRLAFSVAAHLEPEILLVDEVLAVGDLAFQKKCLGRMQEITKHGRTVLFVSHNMEAVINLCEKTILLEGGQIVKQGETSEVVQFYIQGLTNSSNGILERPVDNSRPISVTRVELASSGISRTQYEITEPVCVKIEYEVTEPVGNLYLGIQVRTVMGQPVFTTTNADYVEAQPLEKCALPEFAHRGVAEVEIPAMLLNAGTYEIHVAPFVPGRSLIDKVTGIYFDVHDNGSYASRLFNGPRQGIVLQKLPWKLRIN